MTQLQAGAATDVGRVRQMNEDRFLADEVLFAVADGVGGHQAGEVASQTSVETLLRTFSEGDSTTDGLVLAVVAANSAVWHLAQGSREKRGMGTTLTSLALVRQDGDDQLALVNVGDSRAYLLQNGELIQLTDDHSLVGELIRDGKLTPAEAQVHPQRSIITRALGMEPVVEVDSWEITPYQGDRFLLCSDGLTNELTDERIASTLRQVADPKEAAQDLVRQARSAGGNDNITVVVVDVVDDDGRSRLASNALANATGPMRAVTLPTVTSQAELRPPARAEPAPAPRPPAPAPAAPPKPQVRRLTWRVMVFLVAVVAVFGMAVWAIAWYARGAYFVGIESEQVAIFKGRPGGLLWFDPTLVERKAQPTSAELLPAQRIELDAGHEVKTKAAADRYINNLRQEVEARRTTTTLPPITTPSSVITPSTTPSSTAPTVP